MLTAEQIRAARAMLGWSSNELCERAEVSRRTLVKLEASNGIPAATTTTLGKIKATLEAAGIEFIGTPDDGPGIRIRKT